MRRFMMYCSNCGHEISDNSLYCTNCGAKTGTTNIRKGNKKKIFIPLTVLVLILGMLAIIILNKGGEAGQKYFNTPEAAAEYFVKCIYKNDFRGAIQAFAIEEKVKNFDFVTYMEYAKMLNLAYITSPEYTEYDYLNTLYLQNNASNKIKALIFNLNYNNESDNPYIQVDNRTDAKEIYKAFDPKGIELKLEMMDYASPDYQDSDTYREYKKRDCKIYGYTDIREYYALYEYEGEDYLSGFTFVKYKKGWQIDSLYTKLGGTDTIKIVTPIDKDDYIDLKYE
jgi:hypothetical protein